MRPHTNKIKVCLVAISLGKGGADRSCALLSEMLSEQDFEVHIAILNDEIAYPYQGKLLNLGRLKSGADSFLKRFLRLRKLRNYLKTEGITHVIDHRPKNQYKRELFYKNYIYKGFKTIYVVHSFKTETYFGNEPERMKVVYDTNFKTVTVSKAIEEKLNSELNMANTQTIYNPFDSEWEEKAKEQAQLPSKPYLLSYGRLDDDVKDFSFLINSYHHSKLWMDGLRLAIMGDGKDETKLRALAESLSIQEHIDFLPFVSNPFPFISQAHLVTLTSKWEGFPMVLVESLSLGIPVVSLDIASGPSEIIKHQENGLLISERNEEVFATAMRTLFEDTQLYAKCQQRARASVAPFSKEMIAAAWAKLLTDE